MRFGMDWDEGNWCGTQDLNRKLKIRGFGMHCDMLCSMLSKSRRPQVEKTEAGDQYQLFSLDNEERADFAKFAKTLKLLTTEFTIHDEAYWQLYRDTDYNEYEFFKMLNGHEAEAAPVIIALEKVAGGERLSDDDTQTVKKFLRMLSNRGHGLADDLEGGCF